MCETEVSHAAAWFGEQLFEPNEQRDIFVNRLQARDLAAHLLPSPPRGLQLPGPRHPSAPQLSPLFPRTRGC